MIITFTGQPGSGKTTLAKRLVKESIFFKAINIDGDELRQLYDNKDYSEQGRRSNIQRAYDIARFLESQKIIPVISLVAPYRDLRDQLKLQSNVFEFYLKYNEDRGKGKFFVENYEPPISRFYELNTSKNNIEECINMIKTITKIQ